MQIPRKKNKFNICSSAVVQCSVFSIFRFGAKIGKIEKSVKFTCLQFNTLLYLWTFSWTLGTTCYTSLVHQIEKKNLAHSATHTQPRNDYAFNIQHYCKFFE